ncbi:hypothetical protein FA15DRAFT_753451 [Coprinopsis marcescibilis]|uniref:Uncharacterized protein n=1 Tax=Coprinopsis marcescibilis TaxID=230819 RepID=A0A5C3L939_COPMA|nr:hypothetical protein FA15DRAFT_753451 [Coprinopsis marcescibilis]
MATKPIVQPNVSSGQSAVNSQPRRLPMVTRTPLFPPRTPTEPQPASQHTSSSTLNPQQTKPFQKPRAEATDPYTYGNNTAYYRLLTEIQNRDYENATKVSDGGKQDHVKWKGKEPQHERRGRERVLQAQGPTGTVFDTLVAQSPGRHFTGFGTFLSEQRYRYLQNLTRPDLKGTIVTDFQTYVAPTVPAIPHDTSHLVIPQHMAKPQVTSPMTVDTPWSPMSAISEGPSSIPGLRSPADFDMRDSEVITEQQKPTPLDVFGSAAAARPDSRRGSWNPAFGASSFGTATTQANQGYRGSVASSTDSAYFTANQGYRDSVSSSTGSAYFTANQGYRDSVSSSTGSTYAAPNGAPTDRPLIPTQQPQVSRVRFVPNRYDQSSQGHGPAPNAGGLSGVYLNAGQQSRTTAATLAPNQYGQSTQGHGPAPNTGGIKVPSVAPFYRPIADVLSSFYPKAPQVPQSSQASQETNPFKTHIIGSTQQQSAPSQPRESTFAATLRSAFASFRPGPAPQNGGGGPKPGNPRMRTSPEKWTHSPPLPRKMKMKRNRNRLRNRFRNHVRSRN